MSALLRYRWTVSYVASVYTLLGVFLAAWHLWGAA